MEAILSLTGLVAVVLVGIWACLRAKRMLDDRDDSAEHLGAIEAMDQRGCFDRDEARRVKLALHQQVLACRR